MNKTVENYIEKARKVSDENELILMLAEVLKSNDYEVMKHSVEILRELKVFLYFRIKKNAEHNFYNNLADYIGG